LLGKIIASALRDLGLDEGAAWHAVKTIEVLTTHQRWFEMQTPRTKRAHHVLNEWLRDDDVQQFLQVNRHRGVLWFNKETFDQLLWWMLLVATTAISSDPLRPADEAPSAVAEAVAHDIVACYDVVRRLQRAEEKSEYQVEKLLEAA
ncbi:MAG: hypothetical protein IMY86_00540, partial [Chloroflexi bacterium]|nr:hypothetical protein [Chloroflexota bacterium]